MAITPENFDSEPALYEEIRPTYPEQLFDSLFAQLPANPHIIEVGPATGQATLPMLRRGARVTAVELGANLANLLKQRTTEGSVGDDSRLEIIVGNFEHVDLSLGQTDAVVAATSYHWISPKGTIGRPAELLKPGGLLAVIDTNQVNDPADQGYFDAIDEIFGRYGQQRFGLPPTEHELVPKIVTAMEADDRCSAIAVTRVRRDETYSCERYNQLLRTFSGPQSLPEPDRTELIDALCDVAQADFGGSVTRPLVFTLTTAVING